MLKLNNSVATKSSGFVKCVVASFMALGLFLGLFRPVAETQAQTTCQATSDGPWSAVGIWDCGKIPGDDDEIWINQNVNVTLDSTVVISNVLNVRGRLVILGQGKIVNNQFMNVEGQLESDGVVVNHSHLSILGQYTNDGSALLLSAGQLLVSGLFDNNQLATVRVDEGTFDLSGEFTNHGILQITDPAVMTMTGNLFNQVTGEITNNGSTINVLAGGLINNYRQFENFNQGEISNAGQIENFDSGILKSSDRGSKIINEDGGFILNSGGDLLNEFQSLVENKPLGVINLNSGVFQNTSEALFANRGRFRIGSGSGFLNGASVLNIWCSSMIVVAGNYINDDFTQTAPNKIQIVPPNGQLLRNPPFVTPNCAP